MVPKVLTITPSHSNGCGADPDVLGGHYNPRGTRHGSPVDGGEARHVGDLGNVRAGEDGRADFRFSDRLIKVWDVIGRSVAVAEGRDDLGRGGRARSQASQSKGCVNFALQESRNLL